MLGRLFQRRRTRTAPTTGGPLVYAVGDIHGRADLLSRLLTAILADAANAAGGREPALVFVGDYIDRGEGSRQVIDILVALQDRGGARTHMLRGNHDDALMRFLNEAPFGPTWLRLGGGATLASYGVAPPSPRDGPEAWEAARQAFAQALPDRHLAFFEALEPYVQIGDYVFAHAGVRPGTPLAQQTLHDLMWIRDDFLSVKRPAEQVVVHGHTPAADPYLGEGRIGLDTGAYATGVLTAVKLHETAQNIIQSRADRGT